MHSAHRFESVLRDRESDDGRRAVVAGDFIIADLVVFFDWSVPDNAVEVEECLAFGVVEQFQERASDPASPYHVEECWEFVVRVPEGVELLVEEAITDDHIGVDERGEEEGFEGSSMEAL
jgi:hypothetical protein